MEKFGTLTSCKIKTLKQIVTKKIVTVDYVHEGNLLSRFGKNPFAGDFWANR